MFGRVWWFWQLDWHSQGDDCDNDDDDEDDDDEDSDYEDDEGDDCDIYSKGKKELDWLFYVELLEYLIVSTWFLDIVMTTLC